jgi:hypothetical protein
VAFIVTAVVAVEGAIAVTTLATVLTAVAAVGSAMTVVGMVTHSKELTKVGGVMALVGGVGGLINGAMSGVAAGAAAEGAAGGAAADAATGAAVADGAEAGWAGMANDAVAGVNSTAAAPIAFDGAGAAATGAASTAPGLAASNSLDSFLGKGAVPTSSSGVSGIVPDSSGVISTPSTPYTNDLGLPSGGATDKALGVQGPLGVQDLATPSDPGMMSQMKSKIGAAWDGLDSRGKAELMKSVLAMPGGIQNQRNIDQQLAIMQQRTNQTSYGSEVPTFGIINKAKAGQ